MFNSYTIIMHLFLVVGCIFQQSKEGAEGEILKESWLFFASQPAVSSSGDSGSCRMLFGNAFWPLCWLG